MAQFKYNLLELDIDKLFVQHKIDEITEIHKLLNAEIQKKRDELRSMVGDRYKDILTASDSIKIMTVISEKIVENIGNITQVCQDFGNNEQAPESKSSHLVDQSKLEERSLIIQIRLAIFLNEKIWNCLEDNDNLSAAQFFLLAQNIHTGLKISKPEYLKRIPLLNQVQLNLQVLRKRIFGKIKEELEAVEITAEQTCSNLNGLMLLQSQSNKELISIFIQHRKTALNTLIYFNHSSVRVKLSAMVQCLMVTIKLLYDCFIGSQNTNGLIWNQLEEIVNEEALPTLAKLNLPVTPLTVYIPNVIKEFRPNCKLVNEDLRKNTKQVIETWLLDTKQALKSGIEESLKHITGVNRLYVIREEALKIEQPSNWDEICKAIHLPNDFNIWYSFFQNLVTERAQQIITGSIENSIQILSDHIFKTVNNFESKNLRPGFSLWEEGRNDVNKNENGILGLTMKSKGYSDEVINLCNSFDKQFMNILSDISNYLFGTDFNPKTKTVVLKDHKFRKKFVDVDFLQNHLTEKSTQSSVKIINLMKTVLKNQNDDFYIKKSLLVARFVESILVLCPNYKKCCSFNDKNEDWIKTTTLLEDYSLECWKNWVKYCLGKNKPLFTDEITKIKLPGIISLLQRWDVIEIQEEAEEKVYKSQIKVPLKHSLALEHILVTLKSDLSTIMPHTLPKLIHIKFIEEHVEIILENYVLLIDEIEVNQNIALQLLFDVKLLTTLCVGRDNTGLLKSSQDICDKLREKIDPFDLDVFYSYLQSNVKRAAVKSQVIHGCLLPSSSQLASLNLTEKFKEQEKDPSVLSISVPSTSSWFPLLPITIPSQKSAHSPASIEKAKKTSKPVKSLTPKKSQDSAASMRSSAAALFGLTNDWFS